jgi:hypothetical protein
LREGYKEFYQQWYAFQISTWDFYKGEGCNTLGVCLPHLHLHFISLSIIHIIYALFGLKHEYATYSNGLVS